MIICKSNPNKVRCINNPDLGYYLFLHSHSIIIIVDDADDHNMFVHNSRPNPEAMTRQEASTPTCVFRQSLLDM